MLGDGLDDDEEEEEEEEEGFYGEEGEYVEGEDGANIDRDIENEFNE